MPPKPTPTGKGGKGGKDNPNVKASDDKKEETAGDKKEAKKRESTPETGPGPRERLAAAQGELDAMGLAQEAKKVRLLRLSTPNILNPLCLKRNQHAPIARNQKGITPSLSETQLTRTHVTRN